jgi:hypothetical protein
MAQGDHLAGAAAGISGSAQEILGTTWARGYLAVSSGNITDELVKEYIEEQEGELVINDSRFPIASL